MAVKIQGPSRETVRRLSTRPELADGFYLLVPAQVTRVEEEAKALRIMLRMVPLRDAGDAGTKDTSYSEFIHLYPDTINPLNPDVKPYPFMVEQTVDFILAAFADDLPQKVRYVNKQPVCGGEAVEKSEVDKLNAVAVQAALEKMAELWNSDTVEEDLANLAVITKVHRYEKKKLDAEGRPEIGKRLYHYAELPTGTDFLAPNAWEFYPEV